MEYTAYFNGSWVPNSEIRIDPFDRGFLVGDVVFETERTFNGKVFRLREHIERLYRSLTYTRIDSELSPEEMLDISEEVVRRNEHLRSDVGDFTVHQFVTRGKTALDFGRVTPVRQPYQSESRQYLLVVTPGLIHPVYMELSHACVVIPRSH